MMDGPVEVMLIRDGYRLRVDVFVDSFPHILPLHIRPIEGCVRSIRSSERLSN